MLMLIANRMRAFLVGLVMRVVFFARYVAGEQMSTFQCCICGHHNTAPLARIKQREQRSCYHCGSTMRFRSVVAALSLKLHGKIIPVNKWEEKPQVRGGGMSETNLYALRIKHKIY